MERAKRLAVRASDRERLTILVGWARTVSSPAMRAIAETLATRYPAETEGHLYSGIARVVEGDFLAGIAPLQHVVAMDSLGLRGGRARCTGCEALAGIVSAYQLADSLPTAEREARRWLRLQPNSLTAVAALVNVLELEGRGAEADSLMQAATAGRELPYAKTVDFRAAHLIHAGEYAAADSILRAQLREPDSRVYLHAGRPCDAVAVLQPVLRGPLDASNLYLNRIELQELLAQAWDATGQRDSAATHYSVVARAWSNGDALFKARAERARSRAAGLGR
jgi:tetratricopeptide (TPR) repeat protein